MPDKPKPKKAEPFIPSDVSRREWWPLKEACLRKGICHGTARVKIEQKPAGGIPDAELTGKAVWHWTTIQEWLRKTDNGVFLVAV